MTYLEQRHDCIRRSSERWLLRKTLGKPRHKRVADGRTTHHQYTSRSLLPGRRSHTFTAKLPRKLSHSGYASVTSRSSSPDTDAAEDGGADFAAWIPSAHPPRAVTPQKTQMTELLDSRQRYPAHIRPTPYPRTQTRALLVSRTNVPFGPAAAATAFAPHPARLGSRGQTW